ASVLAARRLSGDLDISDQPQGRGERLPEGGVVIADEHAHDLAHFLSVPNLGELGPAVFLLIEAGSRSSGPDASAGSRRGNSRAGTRGAVHPMLPAECPRCQRPSG